MKKTLALMAICCGTIGAATIASAQPRITISADKPGAEIAPTMWGIFFEDINFGADGGLYAELVKNRSFEFPDNIMGWSRVLRAGSAGYIYVERDSSKPVNSHYLRMKAEKVGQGFGVSNQGFRGMGIRQGMEYRFSVEARQIEGDPLVLRVEVVDSRGRPLMESKIGGFTDQWRKRTAWMRASATEPQARLNIYVQGSGTIDLDMISLFPRNAWKNRENGLRADLVQMLADMKPGFLRFPGGCIVEGRTLERRYQWKTTIGEPSERKLIVNRWNTEFNHRLTTDYYQSFGLGFYEYFLLAEDIGATPMPIINCGMACQFNTGELAPLHELGPYIQDALDLIEFANGPADSTWGKKRADMGHPEPFGMKYLGIGNEQWGPQYIERYVPFAKAIKDKYPDIQLIAGCGSDATIFPNGPAEIAYLWQQYRQIDHVDIVDEHFYRRPDWFLQNAGWYDDYDRNGPKLFVGEYGAQSVSVGSPENRNNWQCALYEAAFMTGMERNADLVTMSCYAPLFAHADAWQWTPDMIWFDNLRVFGTPNYYVQKLFSIHRGDRVLPARVADAPKVQGQTDALQASSVYDETTKEIILKVVNAAAAAKTTVDVQGSVKVGSMASVTVLAGADLHDVNSLDEPTKIAPVESTHPIAGATFTYTFRPYSLTVLRLPVTQ
jgi:alpha-N-arabinofuranosidase